MFGDLKQVMAVMAESETV